MKPYRGSIWKNLTMSFHINPDLVPAVAPLHSWKWFIFFISLNNNRFVSIWIRVWLIILKVPRGLNKATRRTLYLLPLCPWYGSTFWNFLWQSPRIYDLQISPQMQGAATYSPVFCIFKLYETSNLQMQLQAGSLVQYESCEGHCHYVC